MFIFLSIVAIGQPKEIDSTKKFSIGINFSPDYSYRRLHSDIDDGFVEIRNKIESPRFGFTSGIVARYQLGSRFALESGLQFSDKGDKYEISIAVSYTHLTLPTNREV